MAVQRHAGQVAGDALYAELRGTLASLRGDAGADAMARVLVRRDFRHELVALVDGGRVAAYHDPLARRLHLLPFDESGVHDDDRDGPGTAPTTSNWVVVDDPASWVRDADDLAWVHPRYRWVV